MPSQSLYIDASGDVGFQFNRGSPTHLVLALVRLVEIAAFYQATREHRQACQRPNNYEFHWAHIPIDERKAYLEMIANHNFQAWVLVVDKRELPHGYQDYNQYQLYGKFVASLALKVPRDVIENARLVVDEREIRTRLTEAIRGDVSAALRRAGYTRGIQSVRGYPAHTEDGLQLADMIAGAVEGQRKSGVDYLRKLRDRVSTYPFRDNED